MYGKMNKGYLEYAPSDLKTDNGILLNFNTNEELMKQYGYKEIIDILPEYDEGYQYLFRGEPTENDDNITINYEIREKNIEELKEKKILESKALLEEYLEEHPLLSKARHEEGRYYNITSQKQQYLNSTVAIAYLNMSIKPENPDPVSWNDTGEECEPWTCNQIFQLAKEVYVYVGALASKQRKMEKEITDLESAKDVYEYSISYEAEAIQE